MNPANTERRWRFAWIVGAVVAIVAGFLGLDGWLYQHVSLVLQTPAVGDRDFYAVTWPFWWFVRGAFAHIVGIAIIGVVILVLQPARWQLVLRALAVVLVTALLANAAQAAIGRVRPNLAPDPLTFVRPFSQLWTKQEVCFPSGEAATAFALACVLTCLYPRGRVLFYCCAALAATSRLINGAHYLSDVVAGALLGTLVAAALYQLGDRFSAPHGAAGPGQPSLRGRS